MGKESENIFSHLDRILERQLEEWPSARQAFSDLEHVLVRALDDSGLAVQFNPARIASTTAKIAPKDIAARRCFLCADNRPMQQRALDLGDGFDLLVNPFPILKEHFCVVSRQHRPQKFADCCDKMLHIAAQLEPGYLIFYNGPRSGASAPDHLHMQLGRSRGIALCDWLEQHADSIISESTDSNTGAAVCNTVTVSPLGFPVMVFADATPQQLMERLAAMPIPDDEYEPRMNVLAMNCKGHVLTAVIPRTHHRPSCFYATDDSRRMVSPGAIDMCGLIITPRGQDFNGLTASDIHDVYSQVTPSTPALRVGIMQASEICFTLNGQFTDGTATFCGQHSVSAKDGHIEWNGKTADCVTLRPLDKGCSFTLDNVSIGIGFHWQRQEPQTFTGSLQLLWHDGLLWAIGIVDIEDYLASVISSEMKPTASLEFLKAHAVISRSWVIAQICNRHRHPSGNAGIAEKDRIIRWYDQEQHTLFDVCADDHCQRYQGITRMISEAARKAVSETRGQILLYDGHLCDARFSKCCGGTTELFESCWQDTPHPYLPSVSDPFCGRASRDILARSLNGYDLETPDFYRWTRDFSQKQVSGIFAAKSGLDIGLITDLKPLRRGPSGRIIELEVCGTKRSVIIGKELEIRRCLSGTHLLSSAFTVEKREDASGNATGFTLHGSGWGHGVGLCQIGAAVMGAEGCSYNEILNHYYPGTGLGLYY